jgi:UDP-N-acetylglucosamine 2-epimerase (non-hydrolysing)
MGGEGRSERSSAGGRLLSARAVDDTAYGNGSSPEPALRALVALGTRPEAIKLAPVIRAAHRLSEVEVVTVSTGQHESVADILRQFGLQTDIEAHVMRPGQSLASLSARCLDALGPLLEEVDPRLLLVQGDTASTAMAALAGFFADVPVWHIEAGLRTSTPRLPFPEEMNRRVISQLAAFHFAPTSTARENLVREGISTTQIAVVGNTGIDALLATLAVHDSFEDGTLERFVSGGESLVVVTTHRRENWGAAIRRIACAVRELVERFSTVHVVYVAPANPAVKTDVGAVLGDHRRVLLTDPVNYSDFALLLARATVIVTDSGGIQEEAPSLGVPVLVCRDETERTEGVREGLARIVGTNSSAIVDEVAGVLRAGSLTSRRTTMNPYGDGRAAERIAHRMREFSATLPARRAYDTGAWPETEDLVPFSRTEVHDPC